MNTGNSGAVFFLGTRAHYQVLHQPDRPYVDVENGNASTESIYRHSSSSPLWNDRQTDSQNNTREPGRLGDVTAVPGDLGQRRPAAPLWREPALDNDVPVNDDNSTGVKRRTKRRQSETALCEDMRPAQLNDSNSGTPKSKGRRTTSLLGAIASLTRRKRRLQSHSACYLKRLEAALTACTYRESCRCFECQSRYFECDDDEYSSSDDEYEYAAQYYASQVAARMCQHDDDDEVFIDTVPGDNISTDMLLESKEPSVTSSEIDSALHPLPLGAEDPNLDVEVAAGTPIVLNYLLTHPITCSIQ